MQIARCEHLGVQQGIGTVFHHCLAFAVNQAERQARFLVVAGDHVIQRIFGEIFDPAIDIEPVERVGIGVVELFDFQPGIAERGVFVHDGGHS